MKAKPETDHTRCQANTAAPRSGQQIRCPAPAVAIVLAGHDETPLLLACAHHAEHCRGGEGAWLEREIIPALLPDALLANYQVQIAKLLMNYHAAHSQALGDLMRGQQWVGAVEGELQRRAAVDVQPRRLETT